MLILRKMLNENLLIKPDTQKNKQYKCQWTSTFDKTTDETNQAL